MQSRFWLQASMIILLPSGVGLKAQDWPSVESSSFGSRYLKATRLVESFDYRQSNRIISVDFSGTALMPKAEGHANVETKRARVNIETRVHGLQSARSLDPSQLTYVLWALALDGGVQNLGELKVKDGNGTLTTFTDLPNFAMMVTAEPYFAVKHPSGYIVLYNISRRKGQEIVRADLLPLRPDGKTPLEIYEARNAVRIARQAGAERYAADAFRRALQLLQEAESIIPIDKQRDTPPVQEKAREATEAADDARTTSEQRQQQSTVAP
jgi:Domain of unknown function (DUF4398)